MYTVYSIHCILYTLSSAKLALDVPKYFFTSSKFEDFYNATQEIRGYMTVKGSGHFSLQFSASFIRHAVKS